MVGLLDSFGGGTGTDPYAGLLSPDMQKQIQQRQLLGLAQGFLQAGAPSRMPVGFGQALGQGLAGMQTGGDDAIKAALTSAQIPESIAKAKLYSEGGAGGTTLKAAQTIMAQNPGMSFIDAYSVAKSGLGQGVTMKDGEVVPLTNAPQTAGQMKQAEAKGGALGKEQGERTGTLNAMEGSMPQLETTVGKLSELGKKATYTLGGQARDAAVRQLGMGATEGAKAREEYTSTVRDVLFPQLRQTFGAQFTAREGDALIGTLGDPNKSPDEKDAALRAFIDQKKQTIVSMKSELGQPSAPAQGNVVSYQDYFK